MCFACEQEAMLEAYREYLAKRRAQAGRAAGGEAADPPRAENTEPDWAKGTWFAAAADRKE